MTKDSTGKLVFKPEDLKPVFHEYASETGNQPVGDVALVTMHVLNAKLEEWLKDAPVVYVDAIKDDNGNHVISADSKERPTHKARLVQIEEL